MKRKILLLADVKDSTRLNRPQAVYARLDKICGEINQSLSPVIPLQRQYGDELAGLFDTAEHLYEVVATMREAVYPETEVRFVAVKGTIGAMDQDISKVGGEVFKRASQLIGQVKTRGGFGRFEINMAVDPALTALIELANYLIGSMTERQRQVYKLVASGMTHDAISKQLLVTRQAVSDAAKRGGVEFVLEAEDALRHLLAQN